MTIGTYCTGKAAEMQEIYRTLPGQCKGLIKDIMKDTPLKIFTHSDLKKRISSVAWKILGAFYIIGSGIFFSFSLFYASSIKTLACATALSILGIIIGCDAAKLGDNHYQTKQKESIEGLKNTPYKEIIIDEESKKHFYGRPPTEVDLMIVKKIKIFLTATEGTILLAPAMKLAEKFIFKIDLPNKVGKYICSLIDKL